MSFFAIFVSAFGIHVAMRLRAEEIGGRAEAMLATATSRVRWAVSHVAAAIAGTTVLVLVAGLSAGVSFGVAVEDGARGLEVFGAATAYLPAVWVLTGIVVAAFGIVPRLPAVGWIAFTAIVLVGELGPVLELPQWALDLSPFAHVPRLPGDALTVLPLIVLASVAAGLVLTGMLGMVRRDVPS